MPWLATKQGGQSVVSSIYNPFSQVMGYYDHLGGKNRLTIFSLGGALDIDTDYEYTIPGSKGMDPEVYKYISPTVDGSGMKMQNTYTKRFHTSKVKITEPKSQNVKVLQGCNEWDIIPTITSPQKFNILAKNTPACCQLLLRSGEKLSPTEQVNGVNRMYNLYWNPDADTLGRNDFWFDRVTSDGKNYHGNFYFKKPGIQKVYIYASEFFDGGLPYYFGDDYVTVNVQTPEMETQVNSGEKLSDLSTFYDFVDGGIIPESDLILWIKPDNSVPPLISWVCKGANFNKCRCGNLYDETCWQNCQAYTQCNQPLDSNLLQEDYKIDIKDIDLIFKNRMINFELLTLNELIGKYLPSCWMVLSKTCCNSSSRFSDCNPTCCLNEYIIPKLSSNPQSIKKVAGGINASLDINKVNINDGRFYISAPYVPPICGEDRWCDLSGGVVNGGNIHLTIVVYIEEDTDGVKRLKFKVPFYGGSIGEIEVPNFWELSEECAESYLQGYITDGDWSCYLIPLHMGSTIKDAYTKLVDKYFYDYIFDEGRFRDTGVGYRWLSDVYVSDTDIPYHCDLNNFNQCFLSIKYLLGLRPNH